MKILTKTKPIKIEKDWGYELIIHNDDGYCGKILHFNALGISSLHYHVSKRETWFISKGCFILKHINPLTAEHVIVKLNVGDVIEIPRGIAHQVEALEESEIFEVSTPDDVNDSYRIYKGSCEYEFI